MTSRRVARQLKQIVNFDDARRRARAVLPKPVFGYIDGGAEDEITYDRNTAGFREITFRPRMGIVNPAPDLRTTVLGTEIAMPVLTAPTGGMRVVNPGHGDIAIARAAEAAGVIYVEPSSSGYTIEEIAESHSGPRWLQLYRFHNPAVMEGLVERALVAGTEAIVVTIDTIVSGKRENDIRNGFSFTWQMNFKNVAKVTPQVAVRPGWALRYLRDGRPFGLANTAKYASDGKPLPLTEMSKVTSESKSASWEDIAWIRANWDRPIVIKGLLTAEDARRAVDVGANGVIVSNHGGRQLDGAPATIDALPEIVDAVGGEIEVLLDGGVRRGADVIKALSLGARAVLVGRLSVYGLAIGGQSGVERMLSILREDLVRTMRLMGATSVRDLDRSWVQGYREALTRPC